MAIQNTNKKFERKIKTSYYCSDKKRHIYPDRVMIQFMFTHKNEQAKGRITINYIKLQTGK